jgi:hypothetical protein
MVLSISFGTSRSYLKIYINLKIIKNIKNCCGNVAFSLNTNDDPKNLTYFVEIK